MFHKPVYVLFASRFKAVGVLISGLLPVVVSAQITVKNPSFEGMPHDGITPAEWYSCGGANSTPDILPGPWDVFTKANHGVTYLGLITRDDGTWEMLGQKLSAALSKGDCYSFSISLARSDSYAGYSGAVKFRMWGGYGPCDKRQILVETDVISHIEWKNYPLFFFAKEPYTHILIEPYYKGGTSFPYRGNLLFDGMSSFVVCPRADVDTDNESK